MTILIYLLALIGLVKVIHWAIAIVRLMRTPGYDSHHYGAY